MMEVTPVATNLITQVMNEFRGDTLGGIASALGESSSKVQTAIGGAIPALLGGLINKVSTTEQATNLLGVMKGANLDAGPMTDVATAINAHDGISTLVKTGRPLVESLFGGRAGAIGDWVASLSGISRSSSSSLLSLALPLLLGQIGKRLMTTGWNASSLMGLLGEQRSFLHDAPAGLSSLLSSKEPVLAVPHVGAYEVPSRRRVSPWVWALPVLLLIPVLLYFMGRDRSNRDVATDSSIRSDVPRAVATGGVALGPLVDKSLPNNTALRVPANGVESKLLAFIQDPGQQAGRETWFSFDRLEFQTDSATLTPTASEQLGNIAEILKAYPNVKVKIGGYTDNTSDSAHNMALSQARAAAAMDQIVTMGIDSSRLEAEGYGEQHPIADNSTAEGRQRNRRVDIRVTEK